MQAPSPIPAPLLGGQDLAQIQFARGAVAQGRNTLLLNRLDLRLGQFQFANIGPRQREATNRSLRRQLQLAEFAQDLNLTEEFLPAALLLCR